MLVTEVFVRLLVVVLVVEDSVVVVNVVVDLVVLPHPASTISQLRYDANELLARVNTWLLRPTLAYCRESRGQSPTV